jgi:hypothetical protein
LIRVRIREEPPFELGLIAADVIHNLRAALDNMAWEVHLAVSRPPRMMHFPIELTPVDFAQQASWLLAKLPGDRYSAIESLQPYRRPVRRPYADQAAMLNRLWNRDKHRATPVTFTVVQTASIFSYGGGPEPPPWRIPLGEVHDNQLIAWSPILLGPAVDMSITPNFALLIGIKNTGALEYISAADLLIDLHKFVRWTAYPTLLPFL